MRESLQRAILLLAAAQTALALAGCAADPRASAQWASQIQPPYVELPSGVEPRQPDAPRDDGYCLYLCVDAVGIDFSTWESFSRTMTQPPGADKFDPTSGHSWIALQSPRALMYRGHTGNEGLLAPTFSQSFYRLNAEGDPNPVVALREGRTDGHSHDRPGHYRPSFALRVPITREEYHRVYRAIDLFNYRLFSLRQHQCTDFVVQTAAQVGLRPANRIRVDFPDHARVWGRDIRFWTDPAYRTLIVGSPDVLEASLRALAAEGLGEDATEAIRRDLSASGP